MKWSYKTCYIILLSDIALAILSNVPVFRYFSLLGVRISNLILPVAHLLLGYTFVLTLKNFGESKWRIVPFYISFISGAIFSLAISFFGDQLIGGKPAMVEFYKY